LLRTTLRRPFGFDPQIAAQIRAAGFEPEIGQYPYSNLYEPTHKRAGARQTKAGSRRRPGRNDQGIRFGTFWIGRIIDTDVERNAPEKIGDAQRDLLRQVSLNRSRATGGFCGAGLGELLIIGLASLWMTQDFVRRIQFLGPGYGPGVSGMEIRMMLPGEYSVGRLDLFRSAPTVESESGIMMSEAWAQ